MSTTENPPIALKVDNVSKDFYLPHEKNDSLKTQIVGIFKKGNKTGETQHALKNVSFEIKQGEFFGILGRNGSGKSTLLKIISEIYQPTSGSVSHTGKLVPFIELGVGFNPDLTGRENVFLNGALLGFSRKEIEKRYQQIVEFAELEDFMDQKLKNYSSGMQVRLAFSVATHAEADILVVDEVLAVGDADFQRKCFQYFKMLKRSKKTVVFVSHDMDSVQEYCDRAILIENSKVIKEGTASFIANEYKQLFAPKEENQPKNNTATGPSGESRWGDKVAIIEKVKASVSKDNKLITIELKVKANKDVEEPIFGFSIKNELLEQLLGTNTVRKQIKLPRIKAGQIHTVRWEVPNILNAGEHYVDCTIAHENALNVADRWPDAATLKIYRHENNPYRVYVPDINFTIS